MKRRMRKSPHSYELLRGQARFLESSAVSVPDTVVAGSYALVLIRMALPAPLVIQKCLLILRRKHYSLSQ